MKKEYYINVCTSNAETATVIADILSKYDCKYSLGQEDKQIDYDHKYKEFPYTKLGEKTGRTKDEFKKDLDYYNKVSKILKGFGLTPTHLGFKYSIECVRLMNNYGMESYTMDEDVYPLIAQWYQVTPSAVEHNIRNAINHAWDNAHEEELAIDSEITGFKKKPTNVKFLKHIARLTTYLTD